jgi:hypothetical protein
MSDPRPENPWYGRLLGWPLAIALLLALLAAPFAVKFAVSVGGR